MGSFLLSPTSIQSSLIDHKLIKNSRNCGELQEDLDRRFFIQKKLYFLIQKTVILYKKFPPNKIHFQTKLKQHFYTLRRELRLSKMILQKQSEITLRKGCVVNSSENLEIYQKNDKILYDQL